MVIQGCAGSNESSCTVGSTRDIGRGGGGGGRGGGGDHLATGEGVAGGTSGTRAKMEADKEGKMEVDKTSDSRMDYNVGLMISGKRVPVASGLPTGLLTLTNITVYNMVHGALHYI
jgi:hypothetical protein